MSEAATTKVQLPQEDLTELEALAKRYPDRRALLLPALWKIQDRFGYISPEAMEYVAELVGVTPTHVYGVVSFYHMYFDTPPGKYVVDVCQTTSCSLMGAEKIFAHLENRLGVGCEQVTSDGRFVVRRVECLGACEHAPVAQINHRFVFDLTPEKVDEELDQLP